MNLRQSICLTSLALTLAMVGWPFHVGAADGKPAIDPTGTWKVTKPDPKTRKSMGPGQTLELKLEGGKLTGTITRQSNVNGKVRVFEDAIKEVRLQGSAISFTVTHPPSVGKGPDATRRYQGTLNGDTIKGKVESEWFGQTHTTDWEGRRVKK